MHTVSPPQNPVASANAAARAPARLAARAHLAVPGVLTALYAFRAGGFFPLWPAIGAVLVCVLLVLRITLAERPFAGWSRAGAVGALAIAALASWTLLSGTWSHAPERALLEFDRTLLYAAVFVLMALAPRRPGDLDIVLRWVAAALVAACAAGLASRVLPGLVPISSHFQAERLSFPLTYWNALGVAAALATVLCLHLAASAQAPGWVRVLGAAALPVSTATLYLTFSRGGIAACVLGLAVYAVLGPSRRLLFALLAAAGPVAVAVLTVWHADVLGTSHYFTGAGPDQGRRAALIIAACVLAAGGLRALLVPVERRVVRRRLPQVGRGRMAGIAALCVLLAVAAAIVAGVPGWAHDQVRTFAKGGFIAETGNARDRLSSGATANGRIQLWDAALDAFRAEPLHGRGAGTYQVIWQNRLHPRFLEVTDGHSLYLEVLGELGLVGLALLLVALLTPLAMALRRLTGPGRQAYAAFAAGGIALLVHAGVDWDWEMPALFAWWFGAGGLVLARRFDAVTAARAAAPGRIPRVVAGLACLLVAVTPARVAASEARVVTADDAFTQGDCRTAVNDALAALDVLDRAVAHEVIGYCDLRGGQYELAIRAMRLAVQQDPDYWRYHYGVAVAQAIAGQDPRAEAALALRLNPRSRQAQDLVRAMRARSAKARFRAAARMPVPSN
jgi:O-Antigen ligase